METAERKAPEDGSRGTPTALLVIALAQLLIVLDGTIVNIALPSAQAELGIADGNRQWVVASYLLAFGGLLLLGGRVADVVGAKRMFMISLVGFAAASAVAGAADGLTMLIVARSVQGLFAAGLAPATLSLLTSTFTDPAARGRAFGVYSAVSGAGAAVGLLAGGALTEYLSWRWCLYVSAPIALLVILGASRSLTPAARRRVASFDVPGVILSGLGVIGLVLAVSEAEQRGPTDPVTLAVAVAGVLLLVAFVVHERRTAHPMMPLATVAQPFRAAAVTVVVLTQVAMFGFFMFMTYYLQTVLGYGPVLAGVAFLPVAAAISFSAMVIVGRFSSRVSTRTLVLPGLAVCAAGFALLTTLGEGSPGVYWTILLPAQLLIGLGMGCALVPAFEKATVGVSPAQSGVVAAVVNAAEQCGGAFGIALFNSVAVAVAASAVGSGVPARAATVDGFGVGLVAGGSFLLVALVVAAVLMRPSLRPAEASAPAGDDAAAGTDQDRDRYATTG